MGFLRKAKDSAVSFTAEKILSSKIKRYGDMLDLNIDSENKRISLQVLLKGEPEPLTIKINSYEFFTEEEKKYILISNIVTSKEWMNLVIQDFLPEKKIEIPPNFFGIAKMLL